MPIGSHLSFFGGLPVRRYSKSKAPKRSMAGKVWQLSLRWDSSGTLNDRLEQMLAHHDAANIEGIAIGRWASEMYDSGPEGIRDALIAAAPQLPNLRVLFVGDITYEESEISWINQGDLTALVHAFPSLEVFGCRGGNGLKLGPLSHANLKNIEVQAGGLPASVVRQVGASDLPALVDLELWLGTENYGGNSGPSDIEEMIAGDRFPALQALRLRNSTWSDDIAKAVVVSPLFKRIAVLDLSMGTLGDEGAQALLEADSDHLTHLVLSHHFMSEGMLEQLRAKFGKRLVAGKAETPYDWGDDGRYTEVAE